MPDNFRYLGDKNNRQYIDAVGRPLKVGDMVSHCTVQSSSVYIHFYKIAEIIDTDGAVQVGWEPPLHGGARIVGTYIMSWDYAYKLKVIPYSYDKITNTLAPEKRWDTNVNAYVPSTDDDLKRRTITAVHRVLRLDV